jgi:hypothetical protein
MKIKKNLILKHKDRGILMLVPCKAHNHSACWIFESDIPVMERFDKQPVIFTSKKECLKYGQFLCSLDYDLFNDKLHFVEKPISH